MTFCPFHQIRANDLSIHVHVGYFGRFRHPLPGSTCPMTSLLLVTPLGRLTLAVHGLLLFLLLVATACAGVGPRSLFWGSTQVRAAATPANGCNGSVNLCRRRYDQVAYATTHNAMSSADDGWWLANQRRSIARQLADGVRGLMLDTHYDGSDHTVWLCHKLCWLGSERLDKELTVIARFLDEHPHEVITLIFESKVSAADTGKAFADSGVLRHVYEHPVGQPWPTLGEMVAAGQRLVVFTDHGGGTFPWYMAQWQHCLENPWAAWTERSFDCSVNRGKVGNALSVLNHFVSDPLPDRRVAAMVNRGRELMQHARRCEREWNHVVNFVTVDHYDQGDLFDVVARLNADQAVAAVP